MTGDVVDVKAVAASYVEEGDVVIVEGGLFAVTKKTNGRPEAGGLIYLELESADQYDDMTRRLIIRRSQNAEVWVHSCPKVEPAILEGSLQNLKALTDKG